MHLKLLFFCLLLAALLIPADLKPKKDKKHHRGHGHGHRHHRHEKQRQKVDELIKDYFFQILERANGDDDDEDDDDDRSLLDWIFDLQEPQGECDPNPCLHNGVCEQKGKKKIKCDCPKPFKGRRCEKGPKKCRKGRCGRGECVLTSIEPFYECKCKEPFQPPRCLRVAPCEHQPCKNGGTCIRDGNDFDCLCAPGYRGQFCHVGPDDCFVDDGESYRGNVSETDDGDECLHWNSHFILDKGTNPFSSFEDPDGLGPHNFCRNPDGDRMPWCFYRRGRKLRWDYCDVTECPEPTDVTPTDIIPHDPDTSAPPQPTKPEPTAGIKPTTHKPSITTRPPVTSKPPVTTNPPVTTKPPVTSKPSVTTEHQAPEPTPLPTEGPTIPSTTALPKQFSTCGKPQTKQALTRIYGGLKVAPGDLPWQVSLQVRPMNTNLPHRHICGGVLIASCWVLTAGHCIDQRKDMQVVLGSLSLNVDEPSEQVLHVEEAIVHENFRETPKAVYNDIALLRLNGTDGVCATETQFVKTACLPDAKLPDGKECTISGWGATEESEYGSNHLLKANVLLINQEKCTEEAVYGKTLDNTMFCAGYLQGGVDSCQGDSGGPLTCKENNTNVVYGVVSWGDQCGKKNKPGVYTQVTHFLDWIKLKTQATFP